MLDIHFNNQLNTHTHRHVARIQPKQKATTHKLTRGCRGERHEYPSLRPNICQRVDSRKKEVSTSVETVGHQDTSTELKQRRSPFDRLGVRNCACTTHRFRHRGARLSARRALSAGLSHGFGRKVRNREDAVETCASRDGTAFVLVDKCLRPRERRTVREQIYPFSVISLDPLRDETVLRRARSRKQYHPLARRCKTSACCRLRSTRTPPPV